MSPESVLTPGNRGRPGTLIEVERFKDGLARLTTDASLRERFEKEPLAVLPELGITVDEKHRAPLRGKTLSELMAEPASQAAMASPWVSAGVRIGVWVIVITVTP